VLGIVVTESQRAEDLVETALAAAEPYRIRVSATTDGIAALSSDILAFAAAVGPQTLGARKVTSPIAALVDEARAVADRLR
jgi:hypothetical protein